METMGTRIRKLRVRQGLSHAALAAAVGVPAEMIARVEAGREDPLVDVVERLADVLDCSTDYILFGRYTARDFPDVDLPTEFLRFLVERAEAVHAAA
jgi:transcriptional regulator with XRE-family HTH domain